MDKTESKTTELHLAWLNPDGKVYARFEVRIRYQTQPPSVLKYLVQVKRFQAARWRENECDNCGTEELAELPPQIDRQVAALLGTTLFVPMTILENGVTFYIDAPKV